MLICQTTIDPGVLIVLVRKTELVLGLIFNPEDAAKTAAGGVGAAGSS